jgi:hypothetical protein
MPLVQGFGTFKALCWPFSLQRSDLKTTIIKIKIFIITIATDSKIHFLATQLL